MVTGKRQVKIDVHWGSPQARQLRNFPVRQGRKDLLDPRRKMQVRQEQGVLMCEVDGSRD